VLREGGQATLAADQGKNSPPEQIENFPGAAPFGEENRSQETDEGAASEKLAARSQRKSAQFSAANLQAQLRNPDGRRPRLV
jgi:hypothetical protein